MALATGFAPAHGCVTLQSFPLSTVTTVVGQVLSMSTGGYATNTIAITSASAIIAVAGEAKVGNPASGRSALASTDSEGNAYTVLGWPITAENRFEAVTSGTPTVNNVASSCQVRASRSGLEEAVSTNPVFVIDELVDASARRVRGRFISNLYARRI